MVGTLVGFSASLQPNQYAYTKITCKVKRQSVAFVLARVQYRLVGGIYTPNLCYIMTTMPLPAQNILRIFLAVGHFIQVGVYKLFTISDS